LRSGKTKTSGGLLLEENSMPGQVMTGTEPDSDHGKTGSRHRWVAVAEAFFVTFLWSSSFVIIKFGLVEIPALIFAGLRYAIAALILLAIVLAIPSQRAGLKSLSKKWWKLLTAYGLLYYTMTQGTQFLGLALLPATMVSFILNFTIILVVILGTLFLHEPPSKAQLVLIAVAMVGAYLFFAPIDLPVAALLGILVMIIGLIANALSAIVGRAVNRSQEVSALLVTTVSMVIGALVLLATGFVANGLPALSPSALLMILWLGVVNTALAFTLWNHAMQYLRVVETTIINSTMMVQIAILAFVFLHEMLMVWDWIGIALVMTAAMAIQLVGRRDEA
jgi:drug/metabolite transporter (DMT)-like permease